MDSVIEARARGGLLLIVLAAALWGTVGVTTRALYDLSDTNPLSIGFIRLALAAPVMLLACWRALGPRAFRIPRRDLAVMLLIGAATAQYQVCYFAAIARVGVAIAVLTTLCSAPVLVALFAALVLRERLAGPMLLALGCALAGTALLVGAGAGDRQAHPEATAGVLLALASAIGYAATTLCGRALAGRCHPFQPIAVGFTTGAIMLLPFALAAGLVITYPLAGWALLLHMGLLPTALAYTLFLSGMRRTTATAASIVTLVEPLTSTALAWLFFGERLGPLGLLGAALLLGAIGLLHRGESRQSQRQAIGRTGEASLGRER